MDIRPPHAQVPAGGQESVWDYPRPPRVEKSADRIRITVGGETVTARDGDFYGGWITSRVVGAFKGAPGALGW